MPQPAARMTDEQAHPEPMGKAPAERVTSHSAHGYDATPSRPRQCTKCQEDIVWDATHGEFWADAFGAHREHYVNVCPAGGAHSAVITPTDMDGRPLEPGDMVQVIPLHARYNWRRGVVVSVQEGVPSSLSYRVIPATVTVRYEYRSGGGGTMTETDWTAHDYRTD
jgi:hypothetical protein